MPFSEMGHSFLPHEPSEPKKEPEHKEIKPVTNGSMQKLEGPSDPDKGPGHEIKEMLKNRGPKNETKENDKEVGIPLPENKDNDK